MFQIDATTVRYHIRKKHIFPKKVMYEGRVKYTFTLENCGRLKRYLRKENLDA